ncbi:cytochrome c oxidase accessory protein CcoG [Marinobacter adhaerens]|jgi:cytochrome c oxidase accessory protein FixG|uniref:Cytochrome c oxidase accessory protein CcoG n=2 Tax=Marinobacter adhaerens TaxID=1033846 RepID=A0ABX8ICE8_9GAMM|nr:cytochrome c oxidase accessory protein CcoG [Marinobacter adhaerens]MBW4978629.1 cytochrome c oxidase accessory protein CcoG [Marinobacter adhaerens]QWV11502.1 cytochrome c oxidase accessory protein CcoG [Marinobacter adhaerens]
MSRLISVKQIESPAPAPGATQKIQPRSFSGVYRRLRIAGGLVLFALYFGVAWLDWGGRQAVLWDLAEKKFHIFSATFWPEDLVLLAAILLICAFGLFFLTVLAGRVWCGYACPQSVWTWVFLWAERLAEGDRNRRLKLDAAPLTANKVARRGMKHGLWLLIGLATAITFVGYFTPIRGLVADLIAMEASGWAVFWIFFFTSATYLNAGWLREKVCFHMCPYGRFQSSMVDADSLVISYDAARGEPRGSRKKDDVQVSQELGDCIDCQMCVQVCPTGIDIRDGLQMECIGCAACIDACDSIMDKMGYARGLVRYASERDLKGGKTNLLRPRLVGYFVFLALMIGLFSWGVASRPLVTLDVERDRGMYRYTGGGNIENSYLLKLTNKDSSPRYLVIEVGGFEEFSTTGPGGIVVGAGERVEVPFSVAVPSSSLDSGANDVVFEVSSLNHEGAVITGTTTFLGPPKH